MNTEEWPEDKEDTGCVPSRLRMRTGKHWSFRTPLMEAAHMCAGSLKREVKPDTCIGKSWLYSRERFQSDPYNNPFLRQDIMNCRAQKQPEIMLARKKQGLESPSLNWVHCPSSPTVEKTGTEYGNVQEVEDLWTSRPISE